MTNCRPHVVCVLALAGAAVMLPACDSDPMAGYSFAPAYRTDVQTVAVPIFQNDTFFHGVETRLTESVVNEIRRQTPYRVAMGDAAQTELIGTVTSVELLALTQGRETGLVEEQGVRITIDFSWRDARTGKVLMERRNFTAARSFVPAEGVGERLDTGETQTVQRLARDIVAEMRSGW